MIKGKELKNKPRLRRFCIACEKKFMPTGKGDKLCEKCFDKRRNYYGKEEKKLKLMQKEFTLQYKRNIEKLLTQHKRVIKELEKEK